MAVAGNCLYEIYPSMTSILILFPQKRICSNLSQMIIYQEIVYYMTNSFSNGIRAKRLQNEH